MEKEEKELLKSIAKELQAQNRLIALKLSRANLITRDKDTDEVISEMKKVADDILDWCYKYPDKKEFPLNSFYAGHW